MKNIRIFYYNFTLSLALIVVSTFNMNAMAKSMPDSFADMVEKLSPAVVNISTSQMVEVNNNPFENFLSPNTPFNIPDFFEQFKQNKNQPKSEKKKRKSVSLGSGFIIDKEGYIVTNNHVIDGAEEITITLSDDTKYTAKLIGKDKKTDIALLKIETDIKLPFVKFGDSDKTRVGDWVVAIGNPFGLGGSVSAGIISARARDINAGPFDDFLQTDAAINKGNSGGPLFDINGNVIGVNTAIFSPSGGNVGIGFATPASLAIPVVKQLKETGRTFRGWLGVKISIVSDEFAESLGLDKATGALVMDVVKDSPADKAGMLKSDIILSFDNKKITTMRKLPKIVADTEINKKVPVVIWRNNKKKTLIITVEELDEGYDEDEKDEDSSEDEEDEESKESEFTDILDFYVTKIDNNIIEKYNLDDDQKGALIVKISPDSKSFEKGIRKNDIIIGVNQDVTSDIEEIKDAITKAKDLKRKSILLLVKRGEDTLFIAVPLK